MVFYNNHLKRRYMRKVSFTNSKGEEVFARIDTVLANSSSEIKLTINEQNRYNAEENDFIVSNRYSLLIIDGDIITTQNASSVYKDIDTGKVIAYDKWTYITKEEYDKL